MRKIYNKIVSIPFINKLMQKPLFAKVLSYEFIIYVIFGVLTTAVNFIASAICNKIFGFDNITSFDIFGKTVDFSWTYVTNIIAWFVAVFFAYFTNKLIVFENNNWNVKNVIKELISFLSARLFSLVLFDLALFALIYNIALSFSVVDNISYWIGKIVASVLTVIFNYLFSKFIIFKEKKK